MVNVSSLHTESLNAAESLNGAEVAKAVTAAKAAMPCTRSDTLRSSEDFKYQLLVLGPTGRRLPLTLAFTFASALRPASMLRKQMGVELQCRSGMQHHIPRMIQVLFRGGSGGGRSGAYPRAAGGRVAPTTASSSAACGGGGCGPGSRAWVEGCHTCGRVLGASSTTSGSTSGLVLNSLQGHVMLHGWSSGWRSWRSSD